MALVRIRHLITVLGVAAVLLLLGGMVLVLPLVRVALERHLQ